MSATAAPLTLTKPAQFKRVATLAVMPTGNGGTFAIALRCATAPTTPWSRTGAWV